MEYNDSTIFLTGQARPGKEDAISTVYSVFSLCLFIDTKTDCIVNVACTTVMDETEDFIRKLLLGKNIVTELEAMIVSLRQRFFALVQKTLIVALKDAQNRYLMLFPQKRVSASQS
ncbi:MAG: DUF3870 domain-containing protein [Pyramidobacter porci]|uniref:DUF3870 domain-containing protein n=1 Tax=Pyramidobacter porci TaxID=2605789 RepID=UPI002A7572F6|nr:DUF3870 domain-containing protein [Pyramidobacter porci]MDY2647590.1 DUF3870 domain-containing protein [Pyramidobacter porci]